MVVSHLHISMRLSITAPVVKIGSPSRGNVLKSMCGMNYLKCQISDSPSRKLRHFPFSCSLATLITSETCVKRKIFTWYGFGIDTDNWNDKFQYQTVITPYVLNDSQFLRKVINAFGRAQYYVLFGLSIITLWRKSSADKFRLFIYMFMATFLIMLLFELKSRYILFLFPCMLIMAIDCFDYQLPRRVN